MDNNRLNTLLRNEALSLGICDKVLSQWSADKNDGELISMGYSNIDFLLKHHWPSNQTLKNVWKKDFLRSKNVLVDDCWSVNNPPQCLVLGGSKITIRDNGRSISRVYVRDDSQVILSAKNVSTVIVHAFEKAWIYAEQYDNARVIVIRHSDGVTVTPNCGDIKITNEFGYLD